MPPYQVYRATLLTTFPRILLLHFFHFPIVPFLTSFFVSISYHIPARLPVRKGASHAFHSVCRRVLPHFSHELTQYPSLFLPLLRSPDESGMDAMPCPLPEMVSVRSDILYPSLSHMRSTAYPSDGPDSPLPVPSALHIPAYARPFSGSHDSPDMESHDS